MGYNFYIQTITVYHKFPDIFYKKFLYGLRTYWIIYRNRKKVCGRRYSQTINFSSEFEVIIRWN